MNDDPALVEVRLCRTHKEAEDYALVLAAVGIRCLVASMENGTGLFVAPSDHDRARAQLAVYDRENAHGRKPERRPLPTGLGAHAAEAAMVYCAVLLFLFAADNRALFSLDWARIGAAQAGLMAGGAWWRAVTALGLHADLGHLIGNLAFGVLFGVVLCRIVGSGLAWFGIVLAGSVGNAVNALFQAGDHTAVGASTGIFGALGLLTGLRQRHFAAGWHGMLRRWAPAAAGIMLLVFLGLGGERTDIGAHVAGFLAGGAMGFALAWREDWMTALVRRQWLLGGVAFGIFAGAWLVALAV